MCIRDRINIVGSEFSEHGRTRTLFEYPPGKPVEAKLLKELIEVRGVPKRVKSSQDYLKSGGNGNGGMRT